MDNAEIQKLVIEVVSKQLQKPKEQITHEQQIHGETWAPNSLDIAEMVMEFEDKFDVTIPDDAESKLTSVGEVVKFLEEQQGK